MQTDRLPILADTHRTYRHATAFSTYIFISALLVWPIFFFNSSVLFGDYGDTRGTVWWIWARANGLLDLPLNALLAAPFGTPVHVISQPIAEWLLLILARFSNEIAAYNLFVFFSFPLTAIATYFFLARLLHNRFAAFLGGLIFGFCPAAVMQSAGGHASYAFNVFIPLFMWALFHNRSRRSLLSAFYVALSFAGITFTALYFGYFAIYIALFFVAYDFLNAGSEAKRKMIWNYAWCAALAALTIIPVELGVIREQLSASSAALTQAGHMRGFHELAVYSSRPWEYLIPSIDHPVLGSFIEGFVRARLHGSNVIEQTLYLGLVPLGLVVTGIFLVLQRKFSVIKRTYFLFFAFGALWMYFLSLPPLISVGSLQVPTVSNFAYALAPMFRVYARFGILVNFFIACAAAVVLAHLYQRMRRSRYYLTLALLVPLLMFEYWSVPPGYALEVKTVPKVYEWLSRQPGDFIIAEYPMMASDQAAFYTYPFWQRVHKKRMVNGASPSNAPAWKFYQDVGDLSNPNALPMLKSAGVKYLILHKKMYKEGPIPIALKRYFPEAVAKASYAHGQPPALPSSFRVYKNFGDDLVFVLN